MSIYKKLLSIQKESILLKKDAKNPFFKSEYITLDNILSVYNQILSNNWIVCVHYTKDNKLITELYDTETESSVKSEFNILNTDPQKAGSEITYWKRYNLWQLLNIQTDTDDDWNKASSDGNTRAHYNAKNKITNQSNQPLVSSSNWCPKCGLICENTRKWTTKTGKPYEMWNCECWEKFFINRK